jgi:hypothetical protein
MSRARPPRARVGQRFVEGAPPDAALLAHAWGSALWKVLHPTRLSSRTRGAAPLGRHLHTAPLAHAWGSRFARTQPTRSGTRAPSPARAEATGPTLPVGALRSSRTM